MTWGSLVRGMQRNHVINTSGERRLTRRKQISAHLRFEILLKWHEAEESHGERLAIAEGYRFPGRHNTYLYWFFRRAML